MKSILHKIVLYLTGSIFLLATACHPSQPQLSRLFPNDVILAFGDSLTFGTGATPDTSYPKLLEKIIGLKVINAGIPGEETRDSLNRIENELVKNQPHLVIVCLGGNDLLRKRPRSQIKENLRKIIQIIKKHNAQVMLIGVPEPGLILEAPEFYQELGTELNIPVESEIVANLLKQYEYKADYIHFNAAGYQAFAVHIANFLKKQGAVYSSLR